MATLVAFQPEALGLASYPPKVKLILVGLVFGLTFILPAISVLMLKLTSNISSLHLEERKERFWPMIFSTVYYAATTYFLSIRNPISAELTAVLLSVLFTLIFITIINFFWKISAHSAAAWGACGTILGLNLNIPYNPLTIILIVFILIAGVVSSGRLYLNAHTPLQVSIGGVLGFLTCFITTIFML